MKIPECPRCQSQNIIRSGIIQNKQRYRCKDCSYFFTVFKQGKGIDPYYIVKALQLYMEGISLREIERILGISHVSVMNWVRKYGVKAPENYDYHPTYKVITHQELVELVAKKENLSGKGFVLTELGDKFMLIRWERFKKGPSREV